MNNTNEKIDIYDKNVKTKFVTNILFGQKLINNLSREKKKEAGIDYFLMHLRNLKLLNEIDWDKKIDLEKISENLILEVEKNISNDQKYLYTNSNKCIEPYMLKSIKFLTEKQLFLKLFFSYNLVKLESKYYDIVHILYDNNENINGYIAVGKKSTGGKKNIYIVIDEDYDSLFYTNTRKNVVIINDISEDLHFYEKDIYTDYLKNYRSILFTIITDLLNNNKEIKNIVCIGNQKGGNILQLFIFDFLSNNKYINNYKKKNKNENIVSKVNIEDETDGIFNKNEIIPYIFQYNSSMLSNKNFYESLLLLMGKEEKTFINCFYNRNKSYNTWLKLEEIVNINTIFLY